MAYCTAMDAKVKTVVCHMAGAKDGSFRTVEKLSQPENGASPATKDRTV